MNMTPPTDSESAPVLPAPQGPDSARQWAPLPPQYDGAPATRRRPRTFGVVSMAIALAVFVLSVAASVIVGVNAGPLATRSSTSFSFNTSDLTPDQAAAFAPVALLIGAQMLLGTILGITALVLGIIAVSTKRGRAFGVVGIVVAAVAPIASLAVYTGTLIGTLPPA